MSRTSRATLSVADYAAPRDEIEERVAALWADALDVDTVGRDDDFFGLGGDSLTAVRVSARVRDLYGLRLPPSVLFAHPTPTEFADRIRTGLEGSGDQATTRDA